MTLATFKPLVAKSKIIFSNDLVKLRNVVPDLRRDHADQPVAVFAWQFAEQERGSKFSFL